MREDNKRLKEKIQGMAAKPPGWSHTHMYIYTVVHALTVYFT